MREASTDEVLPRAFKSLGRFFLENSFRLKKFLFSIDFFPYIKCKSILVYFWCQSFFRPLVRPQIHKNHKFVMLKKSYHYIAHLVLSRLWWLAFFSNRIYVMWSNTDDFDRKKIVLPRPFPPKKTNVVPWFWSTTTFGDHSMWPSSLEGKRRSRNLESKKRLLSLFLVLSLR